MSAAHDRLFVITGGPGSGKTRLIESLEAAGFDCTVEAGRGVIRHQVAIGGNALPWLDQRAFAELMLSWEMRSHDMTQGKPRPVFCDRGVPDVIGYLRLLGLPVPPHMEKAAHIYRYNRRVFIAPPWRDIFTQDGERKQSFDEATRTYEAMVETYTGLGYALTELPKRPVAARTQFILDAIKAQPASGGR